MDPSSFHCSSEWHFARCGTIHAAAVHSFALHLSKKSDVFSASIPNLAAYFGVDERTIRKAIRELENLGFFERLTTEPGASVTYRPVRHTEWAKLHPGRCTEKETMPWDADEKDSLGIELYAISGQRFKPFPNFVKGIRNTGHSESVIRQHFRDFVKW